MQTSKHGTKCTDAIKEGTIGLLQMIKEGGTLNVTDLFKLCEPLDPFNSLDVANLFANLAINFGTNVQYNNNPFYFGPNIVCLIHLITNIFL